jgi:uncharacterized membrane protein YjjP (DUF1212 family)
MIEGGSEMYRVEDTMRRIAVNAGQPQTLVFTTPTGIFASIENQPYIQERPISKRSIDMEKVSRVNQLVSLRLLPKKLIWMNCMRH